MSRLLEQKRAAFALRQIEERFQASKGENRKKAVTLIRKLPALILQNGLGQALAFLLADHGKAKEPQSAPSWLLYDVFAEWLCGLPDEEHPCRVYHGGQECSLIHQLMNGSREDYLAAQEEALRLGAWLRKFCDAYLDEGGTA